MSEKKTCFETFPKRSEVKAFMSSLRSYLFPGYFERVDGDFKDFKKNKLLEVKDLYEKYICKTTAEEFLSRLNEIEEK